jgi:hypothetical protein
MNTNEIVILDIFKSQIIRKFKEENYFFTNIPYNMVALEGKFSSKGDTFVISTYIGSISIYSIYSKNSYSATYMNQFFDKEFTFRENELNSIFPSYVNMYNLPYITQQPYSKYKLEAILNNKRLTENYQMSEREINRKIFNNYKYTEKAIFDRQLDCENEEKAFIDAAKDNITYMLNDDDDENISEESSLFSNNNENENTRRSNRNRNGNNNNNTNSNNNNIHYSTRASNNNINNINSNINMNMNINRENNINNNTNKINNNNIIEEKKESYLDDFEDYEISSSYEEDEFENLEDEDINNSDYLGIYGNKDSNCNSGRKLRKKNNRNRNKNRYNNNQISDRAKRWNLRSNENKNSNYIEEESKNSFNDDDSDNNSNSNNKKFISKRPEINHRYSKSLRERSNNMNYNYDNQSNFIDSERKETKKLRLRKRLGIRKDNENEDDSENENKIEDNNIVQRSRSRLGLRNLSSINQKNDNNNIYIINNNNNENKNKNNIIQDEESEDENEENSNSDVSIELNKRNKRTLRSNSNRNNISNLNRDINLEKDNDRYNNNNNQRINSLRNSSRNLNTNTRSKEKCEYNLNLNEEEENKKTNNFEIDYYNNNISKRRKNSINNINNNNINNNFNTLNINKNEKNIILNKNINGTNLNIIQNPLNSNLNLYDRKKIYKIDNYISSFRENNYNPYDFIKAIPDKKFVEFLFNLIKENEEKIEKCHFCNNKSKNIIGPFYLNYFSNKKLIFYTMKKLSMINQDENKNQKKTQNYFNNIDIYNYNNKSDNENNNEIYFHVDCLILFNENIYNAFDNNENNKDKEIPNENYLNSKEPKNEQIISHIIKSTKNLNLICYRCNENNASIKCSNEKCNKFFHGNICVGKYCIILNKVIYCFECARRFLIKEEENISKLPISKDLNYNNINNASINTVNKYYKYFQEISRDFFKKEKFSFFSYYPQVGEKVYFILQAYEDYLKKYHQYIIFELKESEIYFWKALENLNLYFSKDSNSNILDNNNNIKIEENDKNLFNPYIPFECEIINIEFDFNNLDTINYLRKIHRGSYKDKLNLIMKISLNILGLNKIINIIFLENFEPDFFINSINYNTNHKFYLDLKSNFNKGINHFSVIDTIFDDINYKAKVIEVEKNY